MLRDVRDDLSPPGVRPRQVPLGTTWLDAAVYRIADLAERSRLRWQVDTSRAHLKTSLNMDVWHGQTTRGVLKALTVFALVDNRVRMVLCQAAMLHHIGVERIRVMAARRWLGSPNTGIPFRALIVNPTRPYRVAPRVKKRRPKRFPFMITPRPALRQQLVQQGLSG